MTTCFGSLERADSVNIQCACIGTGFEQDFHYIRVTLFCSFVQWRFSVLISSIGVRTRCKQGFNDVAVSVSGGPSQGGSSVYLCGINICFYVDE